MCHGQGSVRGRVTRFTLVDIIIEPRTGGARCGVRNFYTMALLCCLPRGTRWAQSTANYVRTHCSVPGKLMNRTGEFIHATRFPRLRRCCRSSSMAATFPFFAPSPLNRRLFDTFQFIGTNFHIPRSPVPRYYILAIYYPWIVIPVMYVIIWGKKSIEIVLMLIVKKKIRCSNNHYWVIENLDINIYSIINVQYCLNLSFFMIVIL